VFHVLLGIFSNDACLASKGPEGEGGGMSDFGLKRLRVRRFRGEASTKMAIFAQGSGIFWGTLWRFRILNWFHPAIFLKGWCHLSSPLTPLLLTPFKLPELATF